MQNIPSTTSSELQCDDCAQVFKSRPALRHHRWNLHKNGTVTFDGKAVPYTREPDADGEISCIVSECPRRFRKQTHLQRHLHEVHSGKKGNLPPIGENISSPLAHFGEAPEMSSDDMQLIKTSGNRHET